MTCLRVGQRKNYLIDSLSGACTKNRKKRLSWSMITETDRRVLSKLGQGGFNLLEVIIASFIFAGISVSFLGVWGMQVRAVEKSRHLLVATYLAEQIMEEAISEGYEQLSVSEDGAEELEDIEIVNENRRKTGPADQWDEQIVLYRVTREVFEEGATSDDRLRRIVVRVTWDDTTKTGEVLLESFVAGTN